ncbi:hypothetical protein RSOLAG22IIIB_00649 [Rhizoctonia solani]|uniref:Uncharacterized protein n=1 Tax=Rhizoctonia solani TaxID=456999 RepID=A0A0K6FVW2_9AGAM|nr:hypothetical protein RSOLAG22IIIB_00649 [Rhizoctonia solani]
MEPRKPYFFYFVTNGRTRSGAPIYNILKHTPGSTTPRAFTAEIRCSDLWHEAYSIKDGCSFVQYVDGPEYHIRWVDHIQISTGNTEFIYAYTHSCLGCGREFAKRYLRQGTLVEIRDVPQ